jgi:hypothetical protein
MLCLDSLGDFHVELHLHPQTKHQGHPIVPSSCFSCLSQPDGWPTLLLQHFTKGHWPTCSMPQCLSLTPIPWEESLGVFGSWSDWSCDTDLLLKTSVLISDMDTVDDNLSNIWTLLTDNIASVVGSIVAISMWVWWNRSRLECYL